MQNVGMTSVAGVEAGASAVTAIQGQIGATHEVVNAVAKAVLPPTQDTASALAVVRQNGNVDSFSGALREGLVQLQGLAQVVRGAAATTAATDELNAANLASIAF